MQIKRRTNLLWGLVVLAVTVTALLKALQVIPEPVFDLLVRAWPALLVLLGLSLLLRTRLPAGALIALAATVLLVIGVGSAAFSSRAGELREDYQVPVEQTISAEITLVRLQIKTLLVDIELLPRLGDTRVISGQFVGSRESTFDVVYSEADGVADLHLTEAQLNQLPMLENIGRGRLRLEVPAGIPIDLGVNGADGDVVLNLDGVALERLNIDLAHGDALVTLPVYQPLASARGDMLGTLAARDGDMTLLINPALAAHLELNLGNTEPVYDASVYNYLVGNILESRNIDTAEMAVYYTVTVPAGQIAVRQPGVG